MGDEYIKREDALKAIGNFLSREDDYFVDMAKGAIKLIPSADVEEVVRCKDCFLYSECQAAIFLGDYGFCSIGER